jgi:hypothetical protein
VKPTIRIARLDGGGKSPSAARAPASSGYSAGVWRAFLVLIIDETNIDLATDAVRAAIDGARGNGGRCVACNMVNFETKAPAAFAVMARSRGGEDPIVRGICSASVTQHNHRSLRYRAREKFALP